MSTVEQADFGVSLEAQRSALTSEAMTRGWDLEVITDAGVSGTKEPDRRPGLGSALARLDAGDADVLLAVRLDRISRSVRDFAALVERAASRGWGLVLMSPAIDLAEPSGRFVANILASAAAFERDLISARTREGLAQRRAEGVILGRPSELATAIRDRIVAEHQDGSGWTAIARRLNEDGVPTAHGGARWHPSTVRAVYLRMSRADPSPDSQAVCRVRS